MDKTITIKTSTCVALDNKFLAIKALIDEVSYTSNYKTNKKFIEIYALLNEMKNDFNSIVA